MFRPGTFVNALRQQTSRKLGCSMDMLQLLTSWDDADMKGCALHATIEGLSLQGAGFQGSKLVESAPNAPEFTPAPAMHVAFVEKKKGRDDDAEKLQVPVYLDPSREKLLMEVVLPSRDDPSNWILAGVALFLSTE